MRKTLLIAVAYSALTATGARAGDTANVGQTGSRHTAEVQQSGGRGGSVDFEQEDLFHTAQTNQKDAGGSAQNSTEADQYGGGALLVVDQANPGSAKNTITADAGATQVLLVNQNGSGNSAAGQQGTLAATTSGELASIAQTGNENGAQIVSAGSSNTVGLSQAGSGNVASIVQ